MNLLPVVEWQQRERKRQFLGRVGEIVAVTKQVVPDQRLIAMIVFEDGMRTVGEIIDTLSIEAGTSVKGVWRRRGVDGVEGLIAYGVCFSAITRGSKP